MAELERSWSHGAVEVDGVTIRFRSMGTGPVVVFVHGLFVGGSLWTRAAERLEGVRVIIPTWPLGAHRDPAPEADLSLSAVGARIPKLLEQLGLADVTMVGSGTGSALCLEALESPPQQASRITKVVLCDFDSAEVTQPRSLARLSARASGDSRVARWTLWWLTTSTGRRRFLRRTCALPLRGHPARELFESFVDSKSSRLDALRTTASLTLDGASSDLEAARSSRRPVLVLWGGSDRLYPLRDAEVIVAALPTATLEVLEHAGTFAMLDAPDEVARLIGHFVHSDAEHPGEPEVG